MKLDTKINAVNTPFQFCRERIRKIKTCSKCRCKRDCMSAAMPTPPIFEYLQDLQLLLNFFHRRYMPRAEFTAYPATSEEVGKNAKAYAYVRICLSFTPKRERVILNGSETKVEIYKKLMGAYEELIKIYERK